MKSTDVRSAIDSALHQIYTRLPQNEPVRLKTPLEILIRDEENDDVITHQVTSVSREGIAVFLVDDNHDEETSEQEAAYYIHDTETEASILDIYEACKAARPDLFPSTPSGDTKSNAVKCNLCGWKGTDEDLERGEDEQGSFDGCPICTTDAYLQDQEKPATYIQNLLNAGEITPADIVQAVDAAGMLSKLVSEILKLYDLPR